MSKFEIYKGKDKDPKECWRWRLLDNNHKNIARSEEAFRKENVVRSIEIMRLHVTPETPIIFESIIIFEGDPEEDTSEYRFIIFKSEKDGQWYWRLRAGGNNEMMAIGGEGFSSKDSAKRATENARLEIYRTDKIEWENSD